MREGWFTPTCMSSFSVKITSYEPTLTIKNRRWNTMKTLPTSSVLSSIPLDFHPMLVFFALIRLVLSHKTLQWLVNYFSLLTTEQSMTCLQEMLRVNIRQNLQVVIQIATKYSDILLLNLSRCFEALRLSKVYTTTLVPLLTSAKIPRFTSSTSRLPHALVSYARLSVSAEKATSTITKKLKFSSRRPNLPINSPLIIVCDRFDFVHDLVLYLYQNGLTKFIEAYVQRVNSVRTPKSLVVSWMLTVTKVPLKAC